MKKLICIFLCICLLLTFAGCRKKKNETPNANTNTGTTSGQPSGGGEEAGVADPMVAVSVPSVTEDTLSADGTVVFQYTYQHMSLMLNKPEVANKVILDFLNRVDSTKQAAEDTATMAKTYYDGSASWTPYLYHVTYSPTRIDHSVLSLFGNNVVYSGATHPDRTCVSASYDLKTGDVLTLASIMDPDAAVADFCKLVLGGLSEMAAGNYLYDGYKTTVENRFKSDASTDEAWYFTQTGLCFYFVPYEIAPYASGVITVEIPYEKLSGLVHEDYIPTKKGAVQGSMKMIAFTEADLSKFTDVAEIVINTDGEMRMAYSEGSVQDVRITINDKISNYTIFAANYLSAGNGIGIKVKASEIAKLKLTYKSNNSTEVLPF